ncbi:MULTISPECIES: Qat anti-phage system TatD family nuclease QatD [Mesorhizobium]|uniref:Qat anti-phage system TatD family nuclease QatD n=1 Tax=Mesorhizobium TaxID=68287 RepID=UPI0003CF4E70|nr:MULTISPECIES: Qat anti-phage system TatD family nuclease QatD [unclassified Mesorhizobium]ESY56061.1 TatD family hydrolase [Mesorhizobium sp. LNJC374B00]ESY61203.1 TatD family hydrolase [Mesorhizobium sp. LNJC372A00]ESY89575.1 TatD family hydrolase [Mesorhizobium sp. LNHC209A00]WJI80865.1 TatD family hydrolase [Mesorhizobium sp. C374B]WJI87404.1 TatD family hydrolase [Mesorhizobium sp. C372A]
MIDFHCHLDLYRYPELAVEDADKSGAYVLCVTTTPKAWKSTSALCANRARIRTALGLHPELALEREGELPLFRHFASETRYFGEVGLDGSEHLRTSKAAQERVFSAILAIAADLGGKILSIHSRRAADEVLDCLSKQAAAGIPILHWFSGSQRQLRRAVDQGCWFSCGPSMLKSENGKAIARALPRNRVLTETDGPFALEGSRPLQPRDSWQALKMLSDIWQIPEAEAAGILKDNLVALTTGKS